MRSNQRTEEAERAASHFIAQRETGPWSEQDAANLERWVAESPLNRVVYYRLNAAWHEAGRLKALSAGAASPGVPPPAGTPEPGRVPMRAVHALAASVVLAIGAGVYLATSGMFPFNGYRTEVGALQAVPLEDGSRVTLNTDSALRVSLGKDERRIELQKGEAYFEVAKDPSRPFVVAAGDRRVVAVGTKFSVRRDPNGVQVIVTEGTVRIEQEDRAGSAGADAVLLSAGTIARSQDSSVLVERKPLEQAEQRLSWRTGTLTFRETSLADAAAEFNRYNDRKIVIRDPAVAGIRIGGVFGITQLEAFARLIEDGFPVRVSEEEGTIVLDSK